LALAGDSTITKFLAMCILLDRDYSKLAASINIDFYNVFNRPLSYQLDYPPFQGVNPLQLPTMLIKGDKDNFCCQYGIIF
jgi:hypothetical protein